MATNTDELRATVRERYGNAAKQVIKGKPEGGDDGTGWGCCTPSGTDPITKDLYSISETGKLPGNAVLASLGCGNPTALAELALGETVLDLGSGGGIDVLLSARRVGSSGKAYGLDMTDEMLELARANQKEAGVENVEFLKGEIENIPLPDNSIDVIISNCVINLSTDKPRALAEAFRVLRPGGRFAVSDIVVRGEMDEYIRKSAELWIGCIAGALEEKQYVQYLEEAGFENVDIEPVRIYDRDDAQAIVAELGPEGAAIADLAADKFMSAFVRATKPVPETPHRDISTPSSPHPQTTSSLFTKYSAAAAVMRRKTSAKGLARTP